MSQFASVRLRASHSSKDAVLAEALIDLLKAALGLVASQIRCSSVDGYRLPVGVNTESKLREEVNAVKVVVGLITPSALASDYVMVELGARWGSGRFMAPLLAGITTNGLSGPLALLNALSAENEAQLHQLLEDISAQLGLPLQNAASYLRLISNVQRLALQSRSNIPHIEDAPDANALNVWITNKFSSVTLDRSALLLHGWRLLGGNQSEPLPDLKTMRLRGNADGSYRTTATSSMFNLLATAKEEKAELVALPGIEPGFED